MGLLVSCCLSAGCAVDTGALVRDRLQFNELVKTTNEQQMLLNIVRLRYSDTPSSLAVTSIAAQSEVVRSFGITPFFGLGGGDTQTRAVSRVLPQAQVAIADRPTITMTPLDDSEFTRKLFTPMPLEGVLYLTKTTWPISTVFRLWLENLNWVSNAQNASGPPLRTVPDYEKFLAGVEALQRLQDRNQLVFTNEARDEVLGGPLPASRVRAADLVEAAKNGFEYRLDESTSNWSLVRKKTQPVLRIDPAALQSADAEIFISAFGLKRNLGSFDIVSEKIDPFLRTTGPAALTEVDLETRSLLQVLYFVSKGVEVPPEHVQQRLVVMARDASGWLFDWRRVTKDLFEVRSSQEASPPAGAHVAVKYLGHWFYIDRTDHASMSTFSLLLELARLETSGKQGVPPALTIPLGGR